MRITALCENVCHNPLLSGEHGLSLLVETNSKRILFDTGQSDLFLKNSNILGIDISSIDCAVLSHGHYDHGGGMPAFLDANKTAPVYISRLAFGEHYNGTEKYIGLDQDIRNSSRVIFVDDKATINEGVMLYSGGVCPPVFPIEPYGLKIKHNGRFEDENFLHEQYMLIEENGKKILFSGCSHRGILNIINRFKPDVFIGGFHLMKLDTAADREKLLGIADELLKGNTVCYTAHCTGVEQYELLKTKMKDRLGYLSTGTSVVI